MQACEKRAMASLGVLRSASGGKLDPINDITLLVLSGFGAMLPKPS
jgi:hypothetical protein